MADNSTLNSGSGGDVIVTREITHGGDTSKLQGVFVMGISGTEGAYTAAAINGDATNGIDVDVTAVVPGSGATNLGKAEDAAHSSGDVGVLALAVRRDSAAVGSGTDGDYSTLNVDASGNLRVNVAAGAATALTDDAAYTPASGNGVGIFGMFDDTTPDSVDEGDAGIVRMSANRNLYVTLRDAAGNERGLNVDASGNIGVTDAGGALTVDGTVAATQSGTWTVTGAGGSFPVTDSAGSLTVDAPVGTPVFVRLSDGSSAIATLPVSLASVPSHAVTNAGTFAVQVDGSALTALQLIDNSILVDDAAFTPATSSVNMAGFQADESSTDSVDEGDAGAARMTLDRKQIVTPQPHTAGGLSIFRSIDLDESEEEVKATAGQIYAVWVSNLATTTRFVKFYNATAANVTVGTTTPVITIAIPGNTSDDVTGHLTGGGYGIAFDTAISVAATTGVADADTGAPGANEVLCNVFYK